MNYGIPYIGSKNSIAKDIIEVLPSGERLVDLFAGGCAITHCGMLSGKWKEFLANDINGKMPQLFLDAIEGKFANETRWISREDFFRFKDNDKFISTCWSFGNGCNTYIYGKPIEPYKKACHYAVVLDDWTLLERLCPETWKAAKDALDGMPISTWQERKARRLKFGPAIVAEVKRVKLDWDIIQNNPLYKSIKKQKPTNPTGEYLQRLVSLERFNYLTSLQILQNIERLERFNRLEQKSHLPIIVASKSYEDYEFREGDVVYCDPPYQGTIAFYNNGFDYEKFWEWVRTREYPVYVSEYNAPDDLVSIWRKKKRRMAAGGKSGYKGNEATEHLFIHRRFA